MTQRSAKNRRAKKPSLPTQDWLVGGGEMGERIRAMNWAETQLGPMESWPQSLRSAVSILLPSKAQIVLFWGPDLIALYNDAYSPVLGIKHPWALGRPARECWSEIWDDLLGPLFKNVIATGESFWAKDHQFLLERHGYIEETYFDVSYDPIRDESGQVGGIFCIVSETTGRVLSERRLEMLRELGADLTAINTEDELFSTIRRRLDAHAKDLPFALVYLCDAEGKQARLRCAHGATAGEAIAPVVIALDSENGMWPASQLLATAAPVTVDDLPARFAAIPTGPWDKPARQAVIFPIAQQGQDRPAGFLIAGINPYRPFDAAYSGFVNLLAGQVAAALAGARAYEEERKRAAVLAELDRAKTAFFSNVSHEFRTPLTLMLGPLDEVLAKPEGQVLPENREILTIARRNGQRLLKLVNTLLDFSRIEAGRIQAVYEPVDLAAYTSELASVFHSAVEKAGMRLVIDCPPFSEPVFVDRDMWEKIVLNLVSNAFKYTLEGEISVSLRTDNRSAVLSVRDTGTGIPETELPNLFNRFHRVEDARGRTQEGTGIGLALVFELAKLHGGAVGVESVYGKGSTFTVTIPLGKGHLPPERIGIRRTLESTALGANPFLEEALRWLPDALPKQGEEFFVSDEESHALRYFPTGDGMTKIVLADDNADMRDYMRRLLGANYQVIAVADGQQALQAIIQDKPDLVLTDVMMPNLDGFGLLKVLRENPETASIPVIMLSARAGEESRVEGLEAGADDYLTKPFSAREMLARIGGALALAKVRGEAAGVLRESEKRLRQLTSLMPAAVYTCDEEGRITFFNRRAVELWGREPKLNDSEERYCGSFRVLRPDGSQIPHSEGIMATAVTTGKPARNEETMIERPDGSRIILRVDIDPLYEINGRVCGAISVFEDVTDLRRAEQASQRLAAIVESSEDAIVSKDLNGVITSWNQAAERLFGYTAEEVIGKPITLLIPPERHDEEPGILDRIRRGERIEHYETVRRHKDGGRLDISLTVSPIRDAKGNIIGASKIARDITRRKRVEVALRESEQRLGLATQTGKLGVWDWDIVTNRISWSDSLYVIHGVRPDQFDGTMEGFAALVHPEDQEQVSAAIQRALDSDVPYELEFRAVRPDGGVMWLFTSAAVLRDGGRPVRMLGATMDITQRKHTEDALRQSEEKLRQQAQELEQQLIMSGRLVSLGEVTASMAHEFNNPLGIIMGFVEDMLSGMDRADPNYRALQIIDEESKRCRQIVKDLMEYARPRSTELCSTSMVDAIEKTLQLMDNRLYKQKVAVEKKLGADLPRIQADSQQLEQVLVNLYLNAIDAMPEGGKLIVEARIAQSDGLAPLALITVGDTGFGIADTDLPKIFQPFFTAKKRRGMGLGLPICQRIVKNHGGRIEVESEPGKGTTFKIYLPLEQRASTESPEPASTSEISPPVSTARTLS
jgi:PAS domain S-box-containing protein